MILGNDDDYKPGRSSGRPRLSLVAEPLARIGSVEGSSPGEPVSIEACAHRRWVPSSNLGSAT